MSIIYHEYTKHSVRIYTKRMSKRFIKSGVGPRHLNFNKTF